MDNVLVTGGTSFLGYHVVRALNDRGIRPRVLVPVEGDAADVLKNLNIETVTGDLFDKASLSAAFAGMDTVLHLAFMVKLGGGAEIESKMQHANVGGTRCVVQAAAEAGVSRVVVTGSALAVGVNGEPMPLDETADGDLHRLGLHYAETRREAEQEAFRCATAQTSVISVCPSFTMGPDDPVGAPANKLIKALSAGKVPVKIQVGFGCLDVRDFAKGMLRAAEHGKPGQRYILNGHNVMIDEFLAEVARISGSKPPRWTVPGWLANAIVALIEGWCKLRGQPSPVTRSVLKIINRYAWYDSRRARTDLGWEPLPFATTLTDTVAWLRQSGAS